MKDKKPASLEPISIWGVRHLKQDGNEEMRVFRDP